MLGIIGALDIEVDLIKSKMTQKTGTKCAGTEFLCGILDGVTVCVAKCNVGKVNSAICAQAMIDKFDVDAIINVGVGCSLSEDVKIKNVVIATDVCQYDMDTTPIGDPLGFIDGINLIKIDTDEQMSEKLAQIAIKFGEKIHRGTVASADKFIASSELKRHITKEFDAICGEMEGGSIGHTCAANGVPFAVLRSISDGGDENAKLDFPTFAKISAEISSKIIIEYIKSTREQLTL